MTAVVHFLSGLFKLGLVGRHADRRVVLRFGLPAVAAALAGAAVLVRLSGVEPVLTYGLAGREVSVTAVKLVVGTLLLLFAVVELVPRLRDATVGPEYLPLGGLASGFFGGLSGMQGALRSAFLARAGLSKEAFVATGVVIACLIDVSRLGVYSRSLLAEGVRLDYGLLGAAFAAAFAGALAGNRFLKKLTMRGVQRVVAGLLFLVAVGLLSGIL